MPTVGYVSAHNDDAILFRGEWLYRDLHTPGTRVTMIVPNCADAGHGWESEWWRKKEAGTVAAMGATLHPEPVTKDTVLINGHDVVRYHTPSWSAWFLRLPDGNLDGEGFPRNGMASQTKLAEGRISSLGSIEAKNWYASMGDVSWTIRGILEHDGLVPGGVVNFGEPNGLLSPGDHPDHYATNNGIFPVLSDMHRVTWVSYDVSKRPANLTGFDLAAKRFLFERYCWTAHGRVDENEWSWWGQRSYSRVTPPG